MSSLPRRALRGPALTFVADPFAVGDEAALHYERDALVLIEGGRIAAFGDWSALAARLDPATPVTRYGENALILPGFIDAHVHYPQTEIIATDASDLLHWLRTHTFVAEQRFADEAYARDAARTFLRECLRAGTTTAAVYCTVHPQSVDAFFTEASALDMRMIAGKVLMDRNAPEPLLDTALRGYDESKALIERWHGRGRALYAITPRFAPTSSPEQMVAAGMLWQEHPGTFLQSHVAENRAEVEWVRELFPEARSYLDVYDRFGQLGRRSVFGHGIWLDEADLARCHETGAALAHCPTSNLFLGSGLFRMNDARRRERPVHVALATDVGGGSSLSQFATMRAAYQIAQLSEKRSEKPGEGSLTSVQAFYLATRGAAEALDLADTIGSIAPGCEADLVVLDLRSTPLIDLRMRRATGIADVLFAQMMLADDRATLATWVAGTPRYERDSTSS